MQVVGLVSGIFFKAKIDEAVRRVTAAQTIFCNTAEDIRAAKPTVVIVDLEHPESHLALREYGARAIAFGPHMQQELLAVAREFGAQAYPRSVFFSQLDKLLHQHI
jgi:hypothetical protein